jgi:oligopeptide/dipeptide ABC transporter ATP-binding protein
MSLKNALTRSLLKFKLVKQEPSGAGNLMEPPDSLLLVKNVTKKFPIRKKGLLSINDPTPEVEMRFFTAVDNVTLRVKQNQAIGVVGESGCGKTTLAKIIIGIEKPDSGEIFFEGKNLNKLSRSKLKTVRKHVQMIFQDPYSSLNPRMTVKTIVSEPLKIHNAVKNRKDLEKTVLSLLDSVSISREALRKYPHEFSGGQRQRISIARALGLKPKLIIADEPISSLDISIQAQILNLLKDLKDLYKLSYIFISHDLSAVYYLCDFIVVMYKGSIVESAIACEIFANPLHPYTKLLLSAIPVPDPDAKLSFSDNLSIESFKENPGCPFAPRCPVSIEKCKSQKLDNMEISKDHFVKCLKDRI